MKNSISFKVWGDEALFTDPVTKIGGEKCSYHLPTYEALKGVAKSIYWKPTFIWIIDRVRVLNPVRTHNKSMKLVKYHEAGSDLATYTYLVDVAYEVEAHFEWNLHRPELAADRVDGKHFAIARRALESGGRQDIFLGTRECQAYVEPCLFGEGTGVYDSLDELAFGLMFHGFDYPDETGENFMYSRFWLPVMKKGVVEFPRPEACHPQLKKRIRAMDPKQFEANRNFKPVDREAI